MAQVPNRGAKGDNRRAACTASPCGPSFAHFEHHRRARPSNHGRALGQVDDGRLARELKVASGAVVIKRRRHRMRSEEHTSELQSLMRISYAVFCLKKKKKQTHKI